MGVILSILLMVFSPCIRADSNVKIENNDALLVCIVNAPSSSSNDVSFCSQFRLDVSLLGFSFIFIMFLLNTVIMLPITFAMVVVGLMKSTNATSCMLSNADCSFELSFSSTSTISVNELTINPICNKATLANATSSDVCFDDHITSDEINLCSGSTLVYDG